MFFYRIMKGNFGVIIFLLLVLSSACDQSQELRKVRKVPPDILQIEQMAQVIADIQIVEALLREQQRTGQYSNEKAVALMNEIFHRHQISREKFRESLEFYEKNLELYDKVFQKVIEILSVKESTIVSPLTAVE